MSVQLGSLAEVSRWHDGAAEAVLELDCQGERHRIRWHRGRLALEGHPDRAAEEVLAALAGGSPPPAPCLRLLELWRMAVCDGGLLTEWARREEPDPARRSRHQVALVRLRREGVQDLLPDLEIRRAERIGTVLAHFSPELVELAALSAVQRLQRRPDLAGHELAPWLAHAVRVRARSAFVRSLAAWRHQARPAALVPFTCRVGVGIAPRVAGGLDGRASWCEVSLDSGWLLDVWARGLATVDGDLVLAAEPAAGAAAEWSVLVVDWVPSGDGRLRRPRLMQRTVPAAGSPARSAGAETDTSAPAGSAAWSADAHFHVDTGADTEPASSVVELAAPPQLGARVVPSGGGTGTGEGGVHLVLVARRPAWWPAVGWRSGSTSAGDHLTVRSVAAQLAPALRARMLDRP